MIYLTLAGLVIFIVGIFVGILVGVKYMDEREFGIIKWAQSEDGPYLFLDMDRRPEEMQKYKYVVFKTDLRDGPHE